MARATDKILVIDVEATCWEGAPPAGEESEIIEIGATLLDVSTLALSEKRSILIRPVRSSVSPFCKGLTTLTQAQVDGGCTFAEGCQILRRDFRSRERPWASFGDFDRKMFERNCVVLGLPYPFGTRHVNVKTLFALVHSLPSEIGMRQALDFLGLPLEGTHHRGDDDSWNIGRILRVLLERARL
jgi:inhibitor of KinA sporulation pathway (predicted exonuclease)